MPVAGTSLSRDHLQEVNLSLMRTKKARGAASRMSGAATAGANVARKRAQRRANLARERTRDAAAQVMPLARDTASQVVPLGKRAGEAAAQGVQQGVGQGVRDVREWAAPRIEDAAVAVTDTVAPKVSAALKATARRVEPSPAKTWWQRMLRPGALGLAAVLAAGGAAAAAMLLRKRQPEMPPPPGDEASGGATSSAAPAGLDAEANGRVRTP